MFRLFVQCARVRHSTAIPIRNTGGVFRPTPFTNDGDPTVITELDDSIDYFREHDFSCLRGVVDPDLCAAAVEDAVSVQRTAMDAKSNPDGVWRLDEATPSLRAIFSRRPARTSASGPRPAWPRAR